MLHFHTFLQFRNLASWVKWQSYPCGSGTVGHRPNPAGGVTGGSKNFLIFHSFRLLPLALWFLPLFTSASTLGIWYTLQSLSSSIHLIFFARVENDWTAVSV